MKRGCIGFSAKKRDEIDTASLRFGDQPSAVRYSGRAYSCPRGTRASHILVAECGPFQNPPSRVMFCSNVLPNRYE